MAKNNSLLGDKAKGSAGNVTFASWRGIDYMKQKPTSVANPKSDAQRTQRNRISILVEFFRFYASILDLGFREMAIKMSAYNAFIKFNAISGTTVNTPDDVVINWGGLQIGKGSLGFTELTGLAFSHITGLFSFNWNPAVLLTSQSVSDQLTLMVFNSTTGEVLFQEINVAIRSDGTFSHTLGASGSAGDQIVITAFFASTVNHKVSDAFSGIVTAS